jgi:hypothetical protein
MWGIDTIKTTRFPTINPWVSFLISPQFEQAEANAIFFQQFKLHTFINTPTIPLVFAKYWTQIFVILAKGYISPFIYNLN